MPDGYLVQCFNCLSDFDALEAVWCSCNPQRPSKVCPFCLGCFCAAGQQFKDSFWKSAPASLRDEISLLSQSRMLIGEMLVRAGLIRTSQLVDALNKQKQDGRRIGEILVDSGALSTERLDRFLRSQHTVTVVDMQRARVDALLLRRLGVDQCLKERILPLEAEAFRDRQIMTLVMADPSNTAALERVMDLTGYQVIPGVAPVEAIVATIRSIFPQGSATPEAAPERVMVMAAEPGSGVESTAVRIVQLLPRKILQVAVKRRSTHLHIQNQSGVMKVFHRIDGSLYLDRARPAAEAAEAMSAFTIMAGLEGGPSLAPRCGRAQVSLDGMDYNLVVRSRPGREGQELSVKLLDPLSFPPRLDELGMPAGALERIRRALDREAGLVVVSAPPFSGATSTLYALVTEIVSQGRGVTLLESPRATTVRETEQIEFFPEIRNSFQEAIARAGSAGTPVLAVAAADGVTWDAQTSALSERALLICKVEALTLPEALLELRRSGYPALALGSRPTLLLHQRLLRRICGACRAEVTADEETARALSLSADEASALQLWHGAGCDDCHGTGYRGRFPIVQTLRPSAPLAAAVAGGNLDDVVAACRGAGIGPLRREALEALGAGHTTAEEITRKQL